MPDLKSSREPRLLVCEGVCNPGLQMFDDACERWAVYGDNGFFVKELGRGLKHTWHKASSQTHYEIDHGWVTTFKCTECGKGKRVTGV